MTTGLDAGMNVRDAGGSFPVLAALYDFYDQYTTRFPSVCAPGCSTCCTWNVTATGLEADYLLEILDADARRRIAQALPRPGEPVWYRPTVTINETAACFLAMRDPPEDRGIHTQGRCLFLDDHGLCKVYARRPFACRAMSSCNRCEERGEALMDPFLLSVNLAVYQIIEDMDTGGCTGNLIDLLVKEITPGDMQKLCLIENRPLPGFLVEPAYTRDFAAFLAALREATSLRYDEKKGDSGRRKDPCFL